MDLGPLPLADFLIPPEPVPPATAGAQAQAAQGSHPTTSLHSNVDAPFASSPVTLGPGGISGNPQVISRIAREDLP